VDLVELLQKLGFSEYEAKAYIALLQRYPVNGAAVAKLSQIPRANVYAVLSKLEDRAAAIRVETEEGTAYAPVQPDILLQNLSSQFEGTVQSARRLMLSAASSIEDIYVQNLQGEKQLLLHAYALINESCDELLMGIWVEHAQAFAGATAGAHTRGIKSTTLCLQGCPDECGYCQPNVYRYSISPTDDSRWFVIVRDHSEMLIGAVREQRMVGIRTKQPALVEMVSGYIRHSIAVAALVTDLGKELEQLLRPETLTLLNSVLPPRTWLNSILGLGED
jgi:HTH-type transcriptional regulator, sugar sensing transcriptional regulator